MAKYYYNGVLLPEIPADVIKTHPYVWIRKNGSTGYYDLLLATGAWYCSASETLNHNDSNNVEWYRVSISSADTAEEWTFNSSYSSSGWGDDANRVLMWSNHDIPNGSATSTTVYFPATYPMPESATGKCEYNGEEAPSIPVDVMAEYPYIYMITAKAFAAFSVRPYFYSTSAYPSTLKADGPGVTYKLVDGKWELNESLSSMYIIISSILWANYNVPNGSEKTTNVYFTGSSPVAINYLFGYLIRSGSTLYTITDGSLTALAETEITASLFQTYGVDEIPDGALLVGLTDPEVLYWQDSTDELPNLTLTVKGTPPLPQMFTSEPMSLVHESIAGIDHAAVDASEDVRFAISLDGGTTWKAFDGSAWFDTSDTVPGMLPSTMNAITAEQWAEVVVLDSYMVRFWLPNITAYVKSVVMHYINP